MEAQRDLIQSPEARIDMSRSLIFVAAAALTLLTGCAGSQSTTAGPSSASPVSAPSAPATATPDPPPTISPQPSAAQPPAAGALLIAPTGVGPYRIGAKLSPKLIANQVPYSQCPGVSEYDATGRYAGVLDLLVQDGVLVEIGTEAPARTAEGAAMGKPVAHVKRIYGKRATEMRGEGGVPGTRVTAGRNAIVFIGSPDAPHAVSYLRIGPADLVTGRFTDAAPCIY
jgi:hypothetical protein